MHFDDYLTTAIQAVRESGGIQKEWLHKEKRIELKGEINLVTDVDRRCEQRIIEIIKKAFPEHNILTEESLQPQLPSRFRWIIDPLDGTTNYAHGYPRFCTSVALEEGGRVIVGTVYDPLLDELFVAQEGNGAFLNDVPIAVSATDRLINALLCTGFPYDLRESRDNNLDYFMRFIMEARAIRRDGSAALDLCYVAAGRFDGFWELKLHPWDVAAGKLIIEEAGGKVTDFRGGSLLLDGKEALASNGKIHEGMIKILQQKNISGNLCSS
jgi:myo-inositol-1(or 4)-monophosphatase